MLWQTAAEKFTGQRLFKRLVLLQVDLYGRPSIDEEIRQILYNFFKRIFFIREWSQELLDNFIESMYGFPEYDVNGDSIHLKKKTDDSYKCPINDVEYAYRMMNVLLQISKDQMILQMMNLQLSANAKKYLRPLQFY